MSNAGTYQVVLQDPNAGASVVDVAEPGEYLSALAAARDALHLTGTEGAIEEFPGLVYLYPDVAESTLDNPRRAAIRFVPQG